MALADSVPGVSGGTVAFILGFYEKFIDALHGLFGKDNGARKAAVLYLAKLGVGWCLGLCLSVVALNFVAILLAIGGILNPVVGALVHNAGSVLVIINSAFLLHWKKKA